MKNLECRAAAFGAERLFGDTLRSNEAMISLARKSGFAFTASPGDWKLVRFEKQIAVDAAGHPLRELAARRCLPPRIALSRGLTN